MSQMFTISSDNRIVEYDKHLIPYLYNKYVPDNTLLIHDGSWEWFDHAENIRLLEESPNIKYLIFDDAHSAVDVERHVALIDNLQLTKPYYFVTSLYKYNRNPPADSRIRYFPFWAYWSSNPVTGLSKIINHKFLDVSKRYKFSCLNGRLRPHRNLLYLELSKRSWFKDMIFSFGSTSDHIDDNLSMFQLTIDENKEFWKLPIYIRWPTDDHKGVDVTVSHPAFFEAYINIVTETFFDIEKQMLSEKSFKPIVTGQLFILLASPGAVNFLRELGIDVFDDIIDHSYDAILDNRTRFFKVLAEIDRVAQLDISSIYNQIKERLQHNSEYFLSQEFRNQFTLNFG